MFEGQQVHILFFALVEPFSDLVGQHAQEEELAAYLEHCPCEDVLQLHQLHCLCTPALDIAKRFALLPLLLLPVCEDPHQCLLHVACLLEGLAGSSLVDTIVTHEFLDIVLIDYMGLFGSLLLLEAGAEDFVEEGALTLEISDVLLLIGLGCVAL